MAFPGLTKVICSVIGGFFTQKEKIETLRKCKEARIPDECEAALHFLRFFDFPWEELSKMGNTPLEIGTTVPISSPFPNYGYVGYTWMERGGINWTTHRSMAETALCHWPAESKVQFIREFCPSALSIHKGKVLWGTHELGFIYQTVCERDLEELFLMEKVGGREKAVQMAQKRRINAVWIKTFWSSLKSGHLSSLLLFLDLRPKDFNKELRGELLKKALAWKQTERKKLLRFFQVEFDEEKGVSMAFLWRVRCNILGFHYDKISLEKACRELPCSLRWELEEEWKRTRSSKQA